MNKKLFIFTILFFLAQEVLAGSYSVPGHDKDDGGFLVFCSEGVKENASAGYYSLDYLYGLNDFSVFEYLEEKPNEKVSYYFNKIENILIKIDAEKPRYLKSFQDFRKSLFDGNSWTDNQTYYWEDKKERLNSINTDFLQDLRSLLPAPCMDRPLRQAVRRELVPGPGGAITRILHYDSRIRKDLEKRPLQFSMLLVHEWLWDFIEGKDLDLLMRVNKILHSKQTQFLSGHRISQLLARFKLNKNMSCGLNPSIGEVCEGGAIYAGQFDGKDYMVTPAGCTNSRFPNCNGKMDTVRKSWAGSTKLHRFGRSHFNSGKVFDFSQKEKKHFKEKGYAIPVIAGQLYALSDSAEKFCDDMNYGGYDDWYLPTKEELNYIYCRSSYFSTDYRSRVADIEGRCQIYGGKTSELSGFANANYWSSTKAGDLTAWVQYFAYGSQWSDSEAEAHYVRCVRRY